MSNKKIPSVRLTRALKWSLISNLKEIIPYDGKEKIKNIREPIQDSLMEEIKILYPEDEMNIVKKYRSYFEVIGWDVPKSFVVNCSLRDVRPGHYPAHKYVVLSNSVKLPYYMCGYITDYKLEKSSFVIVGGNIDMDHDIYESKTKLSDFVEEYITLIKDRDDKLKSIIPVYHKIIERSRTVSGLVSELPEIKDEVFKVLRVSPCADGRRADNGEDDDMKKLLMFREKNGIHADAI